MGKEGKGEGWEWGRGSEGLGGGIEGMWKLLLHISNTASSYYHSQLVVGIQGIHGGEVGIAHAHYDDGHGKSGCSDDGHFGVRHVTEHPVSQQEEDKVLLHGDVGRVSGVNCMGRVSWVWVG